MDTHSLHDKTHTSLSDRLAEFFKARPNQWINGLNLAFAGSYAWRSRVSDLRRAPYLMKIRNRQRRVRVQDGRVITISEYAWIPDGFKQDRFAVGAADDAPTSPAAV